MSWFQVTGNIKINSNNENLTLIKVYWIYVLCNTPYFRANVNIIPTGTPDNDVIKVFEAGLILRFAFSAIIFRIFLDPSLRFMLLSLKLKSGII